VEFSLQTHRHDFSNWHSQPEHAVINMICMTHLDFNISHSAKVGVLNSLEVLKVW